VIPPLFRLCLVLGLFCVGDGFAGVFDGVFVIVHPHVHLGGSQFCCGGIIKFRG